MTHLEWPSHHLWLSTEALVQLLVHYSCGTRSYSLTALLLRLLCWHLMPSLALFGVAIMNYSFE
jgi:hypothetical protein